MRLWAAILSVICLVSCSARQADVSESELFRPRRIPQQIVFKKEISGQVLSYRIKSPSGLAVDAANNLYVSDSDNHRLIKFDADLNPVRDFGGYGSGAGRFLFPEDIVIDRGLNLYVLDTGNRRVVHLDARLNFVEEIFPEDDPDEIIANRGKLSGLQVSELGEITVLDYDNSRLIRMDNFDRFSRYVGDFGYGRGSLMNPQDLASDANGRSYVADAGNGRIAVYDDYGNYLFEIGNQYLVNPTAVAVSNYNVVWVFDREALAILAFAPNGKFLFEAAALEKKEGFDYREVEAMAVSEDGNLYLADGGRNRILVYSVIYEGNR